MGIVPTVAVQHPEDPGVRMLVNADEADRYVAWDREPDVEAPADSDGGTAEGERGPNPDEGEDAPVGYRVEGPDRGWYRLIRNADDEQVGKSVRSEDEAWALLEDEG